MGLPGRGRGCVKSEQVLEGVCLVECGQVSGSETVLERVEEVLGTQVPGVPAGGEVAIRIWGIWIDCR